MLECIPVVMIHEDLSSFREQHIMPEGYTLSRFRTGENKQWAELQNTTDSFESIAQAISFFEDNFGQCEDVLTNDCYFLRNNMDEYIGSAMAWYGENPFDESYGRIHWVVVRPDHRGVGLGKQLICFTLEQLKKRYQRAYLTTQTTSFPAISIYLNFGFRPSVKTEQDVRAWTLLREILSNPGLDSFLSI